jgi:CrcB protein
MTFLQPYLLVFLGAGLGGVLRHILNVTITRWFGGDFPWATVFINVSGSAVMGLLAGWLAFKAGAGWTQHVRLFLATGVLGGYTTFSTFSLESILLIERGEAGAALAYVGGSVLFGVLGLWGGLLFARTIT